VGGVPNFLGTFCLDGKKYKNVSAKSFKGLSQCLCTYCHSPNIIVYYFLVPCLNMLNNMLLRDCIFEETKSKTKRKTLP